MDSHPPTTADFARHAADQNRRALSDLTERVRRLEQSLARTVDLLNQVAVATLEHDAELRGAQPNEGENGHE